MHFLFEFPSCWFSLSLYFLKTAHFLLLFEFQTKHKTNTIIMFVFYSHHQHHHHRHCFLLFFNIVNEFETCNLKIFTYSKDIKRKRKQKEKWKKFKSSFSFQVICIWQTYDHEHFTCFLNANHVVFISFSRLPFIRFRVFVNFVFTFFYSNFQI